MDPNITPEITTAEQVQRRSGYQSLEPVTRPAYWGVDLDPGRRPGVPMEKEPRMMANARWPIEPMQGESAAPKHGRPNKPMPPVFSTALPMRGLSGAIRKLAATMPDHKPSFWLLKLFADRVENAGHRAKKLMPIALPLAAVALILRPSR